MERLMHQAVHANKSVVKFFGKHLEEFRREQVYNREIVQSDAMRKIPDQMAKHAEQFEGRSSRPLQAATV